MRITQLVKPYNSRRYGKPWIARVTAWPVGSKPAIEWGSYLGNEAGGELEVTAEVGDVLRSGQKDYAYVGGTINRYYIVHADGILERVTEASAAAHYRAKKVVIA